MTIPFSGIHADRPECRFLFSRYNYPDFSEDSPELSSWPFIIGSFHAPYNWLEYPAALLEQSDSSIQSIAGECGFSEPALFSRVFTRFYGISPRNYRRKLVPKRRAKD